MAHHGTYQTQQAELPPSWVTWEGIMGPFLWVTYQPVLISKIPSFVRDLAPD